MKALHESNVLGSLGPFFGGRGGFSSKILSFFWDFLAVFGDPNTKPYKSHYIRTLDKLHHIWAKYVRRDFGDNFGDFGANFGATAMKPSKGYGFLHLQTKFEYNPSTDFGFSWPPLKCSFGDSFGDYFGASAMKTLKGY